MTVLLFSSGTTADRTAFPLAEMLLQAEGVKLFGSGVFAGEGITPLSLPHISEPLPDSPTPRWREACRPIVDAVDACGEIEAVLVFDEVSLRRLTAARVPEKPILWAGDLAPLARPEIALYTACALRLTTAIFLPEGTDAARLRTLCRWETAPEETLPALYPPEASRTAAQWLEAIRRAVSGASASVPAAIERALRADRLPCLGKGSRRACYSLASTGLCVKFYHSPDALPERRKKAAVEKVRREILSCAHSRKRNTSCQEYDYLQREIKQKPEAVVSAFPEVVDLVYLPTRGWGLVETMIVNGDGSPTVHFPVYLWHCRENTALHRETVRRLTAFVGLLAEHAVTFYDLQNILIQVASDGSMRFRIADFEPCNRQVFSFFMKHPLFIRRKIRRRFLRLLRGYQIDPVDPE